MDPYELVKNKLNELNIDYEVVEHEPALSTKEADSFIEGKEGVRTKTMFLTNRNKNKFYLIILDGKKRLDMEKIKNIFNERHIKMASEELLYKKMKLKAGTVSLFGLLNNDEKDIKVFFDREIMREPIMTFHPNDNSKTVFIKTEDIKKYLEDINYDLKEISI